MWKHWQDHDEFHEQQFTRIFELCTSCLGMVVEGAIKTMEALSDSTGFLGHMILKQIGVCPLGSFMLDPVSMAETLQTLGANPPRNPKPLPMMEDPGWKKIWNEHLHAIP